MRAAVARPSPVGVVGVEPVPVDISSLPLAKYEKKNGNVSVANELCAGKSTDVPAGRCAAPHT